MKNQYDIVIIGGGPAGLAAAVKAYDSGVKDILIIEREHRTGGILNQCIHNGFGLKRFKESLSGPEYAARFKSEVSKRDIDVIIQTTVLSVSKEKKVTAINKDYGIFTIDAKAIILAMGCRERSRGALNIPGTRPAGIYSAGAAQKMVNVKGYMPGSKIVILGSGDIGLIMSRRMTLEGAKVHVVCEIMPYSSGLKRNIVQCLDDFNIPLYLNHTITEIQGEDRVTGVTISQVDQNKRPIKGTEKHFDCDCVLFSVGLIPENELTKSAGIELSPKTKGAIVDQNRETEIDGIFACGNVLHVHDLVDFVSEESEIAGKAAADYVLNGSKPKDYIDCVTGSNITYVLPQKIDKRIGEDVTLFFRVNNVYKKCKFVLKCGDEVLVQKTKQIVLPGEMETLTIKKEQISKLNQKLELLMELL